MKHLVKLLGILSVVTFLDSWSQHAFSNFQATLFEFDGALRLLSHFYTKQGLVPYVDFGVVYPPGLFLLIGKLIPFTSILQRNFILSLFFLGLTILCIVALFKLFPKKERALPIIGFILINMTFVDQIVWREPFSRLFITLIIIFLPYYLLKGNRKVLVFTFFLSLLTVFFRWDGIVFLLAFQVLGIFSIIFITFLRKENFSGMIKKLFIYSVCELAGVLVGLGLLFIYLASQGSLKEGFEFIFWIPTIVIRPFRNLPLPSITLTSIFDKNNIFYFSSVVFIILAYQITTNLFKNKGKETNYLSLILTFLSLSTLPFSLGRADFVHLRTFFYFLGLSLILCYPLMQQKKLLIFLFVLMFVPIWQFLLPIKFYLPSKEPIFIQDLSSQLQDCRSQVEMLQYNSFYVGRLSYKDDFVLNTAALYLINPWVRPATAFISDEPGLQNSSHYGEIIASQLNKAPKPMLAFLEVYPQLISNPNIQKVTNFDDNIGKMLQKMTFRRIGFCFAFEKYFAIRLYN